LPFTALGGLNSASEKILISPKVELTKLTEGCRSLQRRQIILNAYWTIAMAAFAPETRKTIP
jgi:hypothetical protein